jgi:hypothetical protein
VRDTYVDAAVLAAWAAEGHARLGMADEAMKNADIAIASIREANKLCSPNAPSIEGVREPATLWIWPCPPPLPE